MDGHVQQGCEVGHRSTEAERECDDAHVFNRGIPEEPLDIALSPDEESTEHSGQQPEGHEHTPRQKMTDGTLDSTLQRITA